MSSQTGIQLLVAAEIKASVTIKEARKKRIQRLKRAKKEAKVEAEEYRQEREEEFRAIEQNFLGSKDEVDAFIRYDTEKEIEAMQSSVAKNKQQVLDRLEQLVCDVKPELHHNLVLQKKLHGQFS